MQKQFLQILCWAETDWRIFFLSSSDELLNLGQEVTFSPYLVLPNLSLKVWLGWEQTLQEEEAADAVDIDPDSEDNGDDFVTSVGLTNATDLAFWQVQLWNLPQVTHFLLVSSLGLSPNPRALTVLLRTNISLALLANLSRNR